VIKHIPGHGRARVDSHIELPVIDDDVPTLKATDFEIFRQLNEPLMAMTGHLRFASIDAGAVSTFSKPVIQGVIRDYIGFDGLLMSDDISMGALSGEMGARVEKSLAAGCDVILHCNGQHDEMHAIQAALPDETNAAAAARMQAVDVALATLSCDVPAGARKVWGELVADVFPEAQKPL
jgi:beta-N-acetylhexosaminidase